MDGFLIIFSLRRKLIQQQCGYSLRCYHIILLVAKVVFFSQIHNIMPILHLQAGGKLKETQQADRYAEGYLRRKNLSLHVANRLKPRSFATGQSQCRIDPIGIGMTQMPAIASVVDKQTRTDNARQKQITAHLKQMQQTQQLVKIHDCYI